MATVMELTLKMAHANDETSTIKFSPLSENGAFSVKPKIKAINTGTIQVNGVTKNIQNMKAQLLSKGGQPFQKISAATLTETTTDRVYTQGQE